jgi:hypothetical protein
MSSSNDPPDRSQLLGRVAEGDQTRTVVPEQNSERRGFLRGIAASVTTALGLSQTASAQPPGITEAEAYEVTSELRSPEAVRNALSDQTELMETLYEEGYIDSPTAEAFEISSVSSFQDDEMESTHVTVKEERGSAVAEIRHSIKTDEGVVTVGIWPDTGNSYAALSDGDESNLIHEQIVGTSVNCSNECTEKGNCSYEQVRCCPTGRFSCPDYPGDDEPCYEYKCDCVCKSGCCNFRCPGGCV